MKEENKHCYNCMYYKPFYTKGSRNFLKENYGLCKSKVLKEKHEVCEKRNYNNEFNRQLRRHLTCEAVLRALYDTTENLTEVGQILKEVYEKDDF